MTTRSSQAGENVIAAIGAPAALHMADILGNPQSFHNFLSPSPAPRFFWEKNLSPIPLTSHPKARSTGGK